MMLTLMMNSLNQIEVQDSEERSPDGRDVGGGLERGAQLLLAAGLKRTAVCRDNNNDAYAYISQAINGSSLCLCFAEEKES
jgi:hypothetical protein